MTDFVDRAKEGMGAIERTIAGLPGIKDYKQRELRREADRQVRDALALRLEEERRRLSELQLELLSGGLLEHMTDLERAVGKLQLLIDRIKTASMGYAGWFDAVKVGDAQIEALVKFDQQLMERLPEVNEKIKNVELAVSSRTDIAPAIRELIDLVAELNDLFGRRTETMRAA